MPVLSPADLNAINLFLDSNTATSVRNHILGANGTTTSYRHNGFMVYHDTFEHGNVTVFYSYDNEVPANAANAYLLGIGHHYDDRSNHTYQLERGCVYGGRTLLTVDISGKATEWIANK